MRLEARLSVQSTQEAFIVVWASEGVGNHHFTSCVASVSLNRLHWLLACM